MTPTMVVVSIISGRSTRSIRGGEGKEGCPDLVVCTQCLGDHDARPAGYSPCPLAAGRPYRADRRSVTTVVPKPSDGIPLIEGWTSRSDGAESGVREGDAVRGHSQRRTRMVFVRRERN